MLDAMNYSECLFCFADEGVYKMYFNRLINNVLDEDYREEWSKGGGLCSSHSEMLLKKGSATGHAILYEDLLNSWKTHWLDDQFDCPVCKKIKENFEDSKKVFMWGLRNSKEFFEQYKVSDGICRNHFVGLYKDLDEDLKEVVVETQENAFIRLKDNLELLLRQHDYNYQGEKDPISLRSWRKAARYYTGGLEKRYRV